MVLSLVLMLLPGLTVSAFCSVQIYCFFMYFACFGLLVLWIWDTLGFFSRFIDLEQRAGHRLLSEKVVRPHEHVHLQIFISSVLVSEGIKITQGCQFISSLIRALGKLPGGVGRILPCGVGSHMSRLRHLGWAQCSHGLTSRPLESRHHQCLQAVCGVLGCPRGAAMELLDGHLSSVTAQGVSPRISPWN